MAKTVSRSWKNLTGRTQAPDNSAIEQQQQAEAQKQRTRDAINKIFQDPEQLAARRAQYDTQRQANFDLNKRYLDEDVDKTRRLQRFAALDRGVLGGSSDIDQQTEIDRGYQSGLLDAGQKADAMRKAWEQSDEKARLDLLGSVETGMDEKTAAENAQKALDRALGDSTAAAQGRTVGNLFSGAAEAYNQWRYNQGQQSAQGTVYQGAGYGQPRRNNYGTIFNFGG